MTRRFDLLAIREGGFNIAMAEIKWSTFKELTPDFRAHDGKWLFRGQSSPTWKLETSYRRYCHSLGSSFDLRAFGELLESFVDLASDFLERDLSNLSMPSKIALAQHHKIPTPFLDWTESPYIAAFFGLWHRFSAPSDSPFTIWAMQVDAEQFDKTERGNDLNKWEPFSILRPKVFESRRMARQFGWFACLLTDQCLDDYVGRSHGGNRIQRYDISGEAWHLVLQELQLMGIGAGSLFDSLDGIADDVRIRDTMVRLLGVD
jgi:hypothetical protein